ncbi:hypothetical protein QIU18_04335 [Capnocytophaga canimorsus]|nr:GIY-YIG nuclease family protein [Capnocytophaga canimorsus]WGU71165.1 hypothetical protein QIU18_04335 [Capnocytophaga canimorsus]
MMLAERVRQQQENINLPRQTWEIVLEEIATREDGTYFKDTNIHKRLEQMGFPRIVGDKGKRTEFFQCSLNDVKAAILSEKKRT